MRVGLGYDSHRFDTSRPLVLGGIRIEGAPGLSGHSDGDAIVHAIIDALLGATGLGSIGGRFPDSDPEWKGADSLDLLEQTMRWVEERNYQVVNVDVTVVAEQPRTPQPAHGPLEDSSSSTTPTNDATRTFTGRELLAALSGVELDLCAPD